MKRLEPRQEYRLWSEDGSIAPGVRSGAALMTDALTIRMAQRYTSDLIFVRDASLGEPKAVEAPASK